MARSRDQRITIVMLKECGVDLIPDMVEQIKHMSEGTERFNAYDRLATYVYPKPKVVEHQAGDGTKLTMHIGGD